MKKFLTSMSSAMPATYSRWDSLRVICIRLAEVQAALFATVSGLFAIWALWHWPPSPKNWLLWAMAPVVWWSLQTWFAAGKAAEFRPDLSGKIAIVTGGDTGIGKEIVRKLASLGARVFVACRDARKSINACNEINEQIKWERVEFLELDVADMAAVRRFASEFIARNLPLHMLVCNAGLLHAPFTVTKDGFELQYATNHLGHYLLTRLLLPIIERSSGRIVIASSIGHMLAPLGIPYEKLTDEKEWQTDVWYGYAKLANIWFTRELQRRLREKGSRANVYCFHPGLVQTEGRKQFPKWFQYLSLPIQWISYKATWQGAETPFYCCVDPAAVPGEYHAECRVAPALPISYNMDLAAELWRRSEQMVGLQGEEGMPMMSDKDKISNIETFKPERPHAMQSSEVLSS